MTPQPQTKADEIARPLLTIFYNQERLSEFDIARYQKEITALKRVDPEAATFLRGLLFAITGQEQKVMALAKEVLSTSTTHVVLANWTSLLINLGKVSVAYQFSCKDFKHSPTNTSAISTTISLAHTLHDAPMLEKALLAWHKLHPGEQHISMATYIQHESFAHLADEEITNASEKTKKLFVKKIPITGLPTKRLTNLITSLLEKVED